ncbi:cytochrome P450 monooxygenase [Nemania diffusa]|nr:cytochrome P450 monooxygenase [Nemania diffusa]
MADTNMLMSGILLAASLAIAVKFISFLLGKKSGPLPPGPKGLPLLGNIKDLPAGGQREWEHWLKHKDTYGPISSVTSLGTTLIILHSPELASELLEKRSSKYAARARLLFAEFIGWSNALALVQPSRMYRYQRKLAHMMMGTPLTVAPYLPLQEVEVHRFLFRVLQDPESFLDHIRTEAGAIILKMVYGYTIEPHKTDPLVSIADEALEQFAAATVPGAWLVDIIPALKYIPGWMPGTGWKKTGLKWRARLMETAGKPLQFAQNQMARGDHKKSFVSEFYETAGDDLSQEDEKALKWVALSMYAGGADTTVSTIMSFFLAMTLFPEVQLKAREEIDRVIGTGRLPTYSDKDSLPYVTAIVTEAARWHPVTPMGVPRATTGDDIVNGYYIPKGAVILPAIWWFTHDPTVYPDPMKFDPSRYLGPDPAPDPMDFTFGYGRRICPGRYLATTSIWLTVARSLAVFKISKGLDKNGREIEPDVGFSPGIISRVDPFKATIKPRSPQHDFLIRQVEKLHPWEKSDVEELNKIVM